MAYTSEIEKLERRNAENPQGRLFAPLADAYRKQGEVYRAIGVLREGLERHPDYIGAFIVLGRCHLDLSQDVEAGGAFARVLDLDQENVIALKVLAEIAERAGDQSEAIARLEYLLQIDRGNEEAQAQLDRLRTAPAEAAAAPPAEPPAAPAAPATAPVEEPVAPVELTADLDEEAPAPEVAPAEPRWGEDVEPAPLEGLQPVSSFASGPVPAVPDVPEIVLAADLADAPPTLVDEPPPLPVDIAPIEGLESVEPIDLGRADAAAPANDFGLEREQDIDLEGSAENEFQVRSDAERLGEGFVPTSGVNPWQDIAAEAIAMPPSPVESPSSFAGKWAGDAPATDAGDSAPAGDAAAPAEPEPAVPAVPAATAPDLVVFEDDEPAEDPPAAGDQPDLVVTETMAAVYERQGLRAEALLVYRELSARRPGDTRLRDKVAELESAAASGGSPSSPRDTQPPAARRGYSTSETGGRPVGAFLRGILGARLEADVRPAPAPAPSSRPELEEVGLEAAPTRPAADPVSLSAVFGDDLPPAVPAASHATAGGTGAGFSFDAFFGSQGAAPRDAAGPRPAADDDLEQFHAWLQGLKK